YMRPLSEYGIKKAKKVLTVSEYSKKELVEVFPKLSEKIENMGISISSNIREVKDLKKLAEVKERYKLPFRFLLSVGSLEPRKNLLFLIKSFTKFCLETNQKDLKLVITGRSAWGATDILSYIKVNNMESQIIMTGYVPDDDLNSLYSLCDFFVFPSLYEGFGLPVLEAMACGSSVIVSNSSSIPEVAGDAAVYFNPLDEESLINVLKGVYNNSEVQRELKYKGKKRVTKFSWDKITENIYALYGKARENNEFKES
ncbi:glycosyltransferase family 4 protein, partial [Niallia circulans]|uniref:glycosyltransferase family 4 protein n=1 Tax=Niallia circulans TaxID=1397 RepID=UPI0030092BA3